MFQRVGSLSNAHVGRDFEKRAFEYFVSQNIHLTPNFSIPIGLYDYKKGHAFDLGCEDKKIIVECKSHKWTNGNNVPSAKLTVWNEAMYYFMAAPQEYKKILFVLFDHNVKRNLTLAEYYFRTYRHLMPAGVEIYEFCENENAILKIHS